MAPWTHDGATAGATLGSGYLADKKRQFTTSGHTADRINSTQSGVTDLFADHLGSTDAIRIHQNAIEAARTVATHL